ncbi:MAG: hypothetical protein J6C84_00800 [Lachnospiraceae bacterium]|nr:hypothetical protein [Lachnospiraceae bacterium]
MDEALKKAMHRIKVADRIRYVCLFPSLFMVLFLFYGAKFFSGAEWFESTKMVLYNVLFFAVLIMLVSSVLKIFFAMSYNKLLKKKNRM